VETGEQTLIRQAQQGSTIAFEALVNKHAQLVYNLALRTLNDPQEAEDAAQEAFIRTWRSLPRFQSKSRFTTWLYRIVTNVCYDRLPQLKAELAALEPGEEMALADDQPPVETRLITAERHAVLHNAIETLPDSYRLLITLRHLQGMAYTEIAGVTGMPLGSVKTGIFRARRALRQTLESYERSEHERL